MKKVHLYMKNYRHFTVNCDEIATNRASYYANREKFSQEVFDEELLYTLESNSELIDWLLDNMDWYNCKTLEEVKPEEVPVKEFVIDGCKVR